ncbi:MAG: HAMP domain-containing histidine kinase [Oligosphaeraceae bacterium]|nr:HAMP domain-containing histidine kinase [Oligosphaeraceae bacterium]
MLFWGVLWTVGVTCAAVSAGIWLANRDQEQHYIRDAGVNLSRVIAELHLPPTTGLVGKLKQISECEVVLAEGPTVLAATLSAAELEGLSHFWTTGGNADRVLPAERYWLYARAVAGTDLCLWLFLPRRQWPSSLRESSSGIIIAGLAGGVLAFLAWWLIAGSYQRLWRRLQTANSRLELAERLALAGKMSAAVVHELRNPLSGIKMNAQVLQEELCAAGRPDECVQFMVKEIDRIEAYLQELSGRSPGEAITAAAALSLPELLQDLDRLLRQRFQHSGVQLQCQNLLPGPVTLPVPHRLLREILVNLLSNALEASTAGASVSLTVSQNRGDNNILFAVADQGEGVKCSPGEDIFAPFFSSKKRGCGLGLYFAANAASRLGGTLSWYNASPGAVFVLSVPPQH